MTGLKTIFVSLILTTLLSCNNGSDKKAVVEYKDGKQVPIIDMDLSDINIYAPDSITVGKQYCAKIWLTTKDRKLLKAFAVCDFTLSLVDTVDMTLDNCDGNQLWIINDTVHICFTPTIKTLENKFEIALLAKGYDNLYHLQTLDIVSESLKKTSR